MADDTLPLLYVPGSTVLHVNRHADAGQTGQRLRIDCSRVEGIVSVELVDELARSGARVCAACQRSSGVARHYQRRIELRREAQAARAVALSPGLAEPAQLLLEV